MSYTMFGKEISPIGYGLMSLTWHPREEQTDDQKFAVMKAALSKGANAWNGGEFYGDVNAENSLTLLRRYFARYPEDAKKVSINIKGAARQPGDGSLINDNSPTYVRQSVNHCLELLNGKDGAKENEARIDLFEMARRMTQKEYLDSLRVLQTEFVDTGKIGGICLSEVNSHTIRQAAKVAKISAVEIELSMFETSPLHNGIVEACADLGIPIFAYSPIGRGFLAGKIPDGGFAQFLPRTSQKEHLEHNMKLAEAVKGWAAAKGCTPAQFAINWLVGLSGDKKKNCPTIIPIPGSASEVRAAENSAVVPLTEGEMEEVDRFLAKFEIKGDRLAGAMTAMLDSNTSEDV